MGSNVIYSPPSWEKGHKGEYIAHLIVWILVLPLWLPFIILDLIFDFTGRRRKARKEEEGFKKFLKKEKELNINSENDLPNWLK